MAGAGSSFVAVEIPAAPPPDPQEPQTKGREPVRMGARTFMEENCRKVGHSCHRRDFFHPGLAWRKPARPFREKRSAHFAKQRARFRNGFRFLLGRHAGIARAPDTPRILFQSKRFLESGNKNKALADSRGGATNWPHIEYPHLSKGRRMMGGRVNAAFLKPASTTNIISMSQKVCVAAPRSVWKACGGQPTNGKTRLLITKPTDFFPEVRSLTAALGDQWSVECGQGGDGRHTPPGRGTKDHRYKGRLIAVPAGPPPHWPPEIKTKKRINFHTWEHRVNGKVSDQRPWSDPRPWVGVPNTGDRLPKGGGPMTLKSARRLMKISVPGFGATQLILTRPQWTDWLGQFSFSPDSSWIQATWTVAEAGLIKVLMARPAAFG